MPEDIRIMQSDEIEDGFNARCLEIAKQMESLCDWLREQRPRYMNQDFDNGFIHAAQTIVEQMIDPDYAPFKAERAERINRRLRQAIEKPGPTDRDTDRGDVDAETAL